ncbi:MAG: aspartate carbamoyltransferase [Candidatus Heimdallarchaeota archaeon]|nr:aspartate carbamoyltransferase [Candidatus Heimdallarchaeota archaeon]
MFTRKRRTKVNDSNLDKRHIIRIRDMSEEFIQTIIDETYQIKNHPNDFNDVLKGKILALAFWEPSTRTRLSFESAMLRLGGQTMGFSSQSGTSIEKGESLSDTITMLASYAHCIVLRHPKRGSGVLAAKVADKYGVPVISGGSGSQEHPTQALLDIFTIHEYHKRLSGLKLGIMGDLRYSRTISSLLYGLSKFGKNEIYSISHPSLGLQEELLFDLSETQLEITTSASLTDVIADLDVLYVTRLQKERFPDPMLYNKVKGAYQVQLEMIRLAKDDLIIMHPLPRVDEIPYGVDRLPQAKYFEQAKNGVYTRMALLKRIITDSKQKARG